jgi:hypothetical protein
MHTDVTGIKVTTATIETENTLYAEVTIPIHRCFESGEACRHKLHAYYGEVSPGDFLVGKN